MTGTANVSLRIEDIELTRIPLPPIDEQRRIAAVLRDADTNIAHVEAQIDAAREIKRGAMQQLFTYGLAGEGAPTKQTRIGEIPAGWEVVKFDELITEAQNGLYKPNSFYGNGVPVIRVDTFEDGQILEELPIMNCRTRVWEGMEIVS